MEAASRIGWPTARITLTKGMTMSLPPPSHPRWSEVLLDARPIELRFLGARLTLGRLKASVAAHPDTLPAAVAELHDFFAKLEHQPHVQADIKAIFG